MSIPCGVPSDSGWRRLLCLDNRNLLTVARVLSRDAALLAFVTGDCLDCLIAVLWCLVFVVMRSVMALMYGNSCKIILLLYHGIVILSSYYYIAVVLLLFRVIVYCAMVLFMLSY